MTDPPAPAPEPAPEPEPAPPSQSYELPGPRRVVAAGLQLALAAARDLRRASIYIGLLALAALGPAVAFAIATIDRHDLDLAVVIEDLVLGEGLYFFQHPELVGPLLFLEALVGIGLVVLLAISIDAQAIGIGLLAGQAVGRPMTLPEAVSRARQVFWRLVAGSFLVGAYSTVIQIVLGLVVGTGAVPNLALEFTIAVAATLATVPFAYLAAGIVLGDVGAIEALRRSTRLFRARPATAVVVVLLTLVTAAIETFALGAGLDLVGRVGEALGLELTAGGFALVLPIVFSLATITAFGSLLFTIAALVSAPQVAAFLGLTFYGAGLDRARVEGGRPRDFRWVTRPMRVAFGVLAGSVLLGIPAVAFGPDPAPSDGGDSAIAAFLVERAASAGEEVTVIGVIVGFDDPPGDQFGGDEPIADVVRAEVALLDTVPDWLLDETFTCGVTTSVCGGPDDERWPYEDGALLFLQRMSSPPEVRDRATSGEWGPLLRLDGFEGIPVMSGTYLADVTDSFLTRISGGVATIHHWGTDADMSGEYETFARSAWVGRDLLTLVPVSEIPTEPLAWDAYASATSLDRHDSLRPTAGGPMPVFGFPATITFTPPASEGPDS